MKKPFIIGLVVFFALLGIGYFCVISWLVGPKVQGKTVVKWTEEVASRDEAVKKAAKETMQKHAAEFLPEMIALLKTQDSAERQKWATVLKVEYTPSYAARLAATRAFSIIGSGGAPAIPELLPMLADFSIGMDAASSLASIGKDSVQPLINKITAANGSGKAMAAASLSKMKGDMAAPAIDALLTLAKDADAENQEWAVKALGNIALKPETCIPVFIGLLDSKHTGVVTAAIAGLGNFGPAAKEALPKLEALTKSRVEDIKGGAVGAVYKISGAAQKEEADAKKSE